MNNPMSAREKAAAPSPAPLFLVMEYVMSKRAFALLALLASSACAAAAAPAPVAAAHEAARVSVSARVETVSCSVEARRTRGGVEIAGFAYADRFVTGEYELVITKTGRDGSSDIVQSGPFETHQGAAEPLGVSELSLERGAHYRARLILRDDRGEICRDSIRA